MRKRSKYSRRQPSNCFFAIGTTLSRAWTVFQSLEVTTTSSRLTRPSSISLFNPSPASFSLPINPPSAHVPRIHIAQVSRTVIASTVKEPVASLDGIVDNVGSVLGDLPEAESDLGHLGPVGLEG